MKIAILIWQLSTICKSEFEIFILWYRIDKNINQYFFKNHTKYRGWGCRHLGFILFFDFEMFMSSFLFLAILCLKYFFSKHNLLLPDYMNYYTFVGYNNKVERGCKFPLNHLIFGSNYLIQPKDIKCQIYMGLLMYWTYILIFWHETHFFK